MAARIAIVGAGPSGSSLALFLLRRGVDPRDIVLYDKATFPRPKLCGGGITFRGTELLEDLVGRPAGGGETVGLEFRSRIGRFAVREIGKQWVYDRGELDAQLLDAVRNAGVPIREGVQVKAIVAGHGGRRIETQHGAETHAWVVGADGATSLVRREAGLRGGIVGRLVEGVFESVSANVSDDVLYFDFDPVSDDPRWLNRRLPIQVGFGSNYSSMVFDVMLVPKFRPELTQQAAGQTAPPEPPPSSPANAGVLRVTWFLLALPLMLPY